MRSDLRAFLLWLIPALVVGIAVARVSVWVQPHFAPLLLYPLLLGLSLGVIQCGLLQLVGLCNRRLVLTGAILVALAAAAAEHGFFYLDRRSEYERKALEAGIPDEALSSETFTEYMHNQAKLDRMQIPLWIGNALVMAMAAGGMVVWYLKSGGFRSAVVAAEVGKGHPHPSSLPEGEGTSHPSPLPNGEGTRSP